MQIQYIEELKEKFRTLNITQVLSQPTEIQGIDRLQQLGVYLFTEAEEGTA